MGLPPHNSCRDLVPLALAVACALLLSGCGPTTPSYVAPQQDPGPSNPAHLTADGFLVVHARIFPAMLDRALHAARIADLVDRVATAANDIDPQGHAILGTAAGFAAREGRLDDARLMLAVAIDAGSDTPEFYAEVANALVDVGQFALARDVAFDGQDKYPDSEVLLAAADRSIDEDPVLMPPEIRRIEPGKGADLIKALGGGSTVTLKAKVGDETIAAFKPDQDLGQSMYRSEIAYYKLCNIIRCGFRVPYNEHVKISRSDFEELYDKVDSEKQRNYRSKFVHLRWANESGVEYLHGTWKEWVPAFTGFPIEATAAWTPWLLPNSQSDLTSLLSDWLPDLAGIAGPRGWSKHKKRMGFAGDLTKLDVAHQISDLLVMDYMANNWDRFSGDVELWGANCHMEPGGLLALDNGAAFPPWDTKRVVRRLKLTKRFRKKFIDAIRRLDRDKTLARLFPGPNKDETKRFEVFWERRQELLDYVDALVEKHGADAVYF